jgi:hypothetical protein
MRKESAPVKILLATWNPDKIGWLTKGFEALGMPIEAADPAECGLPLCAMRPTRGAIR